MNWVNGKAASAMVLLFTRLFRKVVDLDRTVWKARDHIQLSAHGFNVAAQR